MSFTDDILKDIDEINEWINAECVQTFIDFGKFVVAYSPTQPDAYSAKGLFINSWFPAENEFDPTVGTVANLQGEYSLNRIEATKLSKIFYKQDGFISLSNNLDYAENVEYSGWPTPKWSGTVGPYAPVRQAIVALQGFYKT